MTVSRANADDAKRGRERIAILAAALDPAGAERVTLNLAEYFVNKGYDVDLVLVRRRGALLAEVPPAVRVVDLASKRALTAVRPFRKYLREVRPMAVFAINFEVNLTAAAARVGLSQPPKLVLSVHCAPRQLLARDRPLRRFVATLAGKFLYRMADRVVAVSQGASDDLETLKWCDPARIVTIHNPVVRADFDGLAGQRIDHPWATDPRTPLIVGTGRLTAQKNFDLLLRAFARISDRTRARLLILGDGEEREALETRIDQLGLRGRASLLGHVSNPYPYMRQADLFVLSSAFEGFGNVIVEAMAAGTPVVSTDCEHGPREILEDGKWGRLVPPGDECALADAMIESLLADEKATVGKRLRRRAEDFTLGAAGSKYLELVDGANRP